MNVRSRQWSRRQYSSAVPAVRRRGPVVRRIGMVNMVAVTILGVLGLLYVLLINDLSTKVYEVRSLNRRIDDVSSETIRLKQEAAHEQSRTEIVSRLEHYPFVPEGTVEYARDSSVALGSTPLR